MVLCTEQSLVKHDGTVLVVKPLRCKCWGCDHCKHQRKRDLYWKARNGDPRIFLTLTMKHIHGSPDEQAEQFVVGWRMLRQFLCRHLNRKKLDFIAVFEAHPTSGWPHLHILLRGGFIDHRLIRRWWEHRFQSFQIHIKLAKNGSQSAAYVAKYMSGDTRKFGSCKRYWSSQGWELKKPGHEKPIYGEDVWFERFGMSVMNMARVALGDGARIEFKNDSLIISGWASEARATWGCG